MKIIHTSDWHLGQNFYNKSRKHEHESFLNWLIKLVKQQNIDAVLVAGDIFDTGTPPSYARLLFNQFVVKLNALNIQLVILGGNHDSISTLSESRDLLACLNTSVIAGVTEKIEDQIIDITNQKGEVLGLVCAIPFLRPQQILSSEAGQTGSEKRKSLQQAITDYYHLSFQQAEKRKKQLKLNIPIIATGHLTTIGAKVSDSVRDIYIGTLETFSSNNFPPADYIALGHIHSSQMVSKNQHMRYSGSPIALSFDELNVRKSVLKVSFEGDKLIQVDEIEIPIFQKIISISGDLTEIEKQINALIKENDKTTEIWLDIEVDDQEYWHDLIDQVNKMVGDCSFEILKLSRKSNKVQQVLGAEYQESLHELIPTDVFTKKLSSIDELKSVPKKQLLNAFQIIIDELELNENN